MSRAKSAACDTLDEAEMLETLNDAFRSRRLLKEAVAWFESQRPNWGPGTLPTWYVDAKDMGII